MDYMGTSHFSDLTAPGIVVDDVSRCKERLVYSLIGFIIQDMHNIMVKSLPSGCRLTAILDVSKILCRL